ncbi:zeta toxin family protein [Allopusillimonas ginsengisoli]|uniref:zeta toxin family protein n=1 Tax=Allopusillimonas ginsengisoli TaxID=453575 RepID=UPI00101EB3DD|nr:zeta toxin family protein [Allopusillimonas ginsengisoli]TEA80143.1 hypothetical protein ERE07_04275 [Allopusillimonas ginsengisoli]
MILAAEIGPPVLIILAGPNGAGKSTLYRNELQDRYRSLEFINPDELAMRHFGHAAQTLEESRKGQHLADARREALMAANQSFITESTFSHLSKLELLQQAQAAGYRVFVYHVNVQSPTLSVLRVAHRVSQGGHPVPEDKIRGRYERNQQLIRQAVIRADRAYVFDNSMAAQPHRLALEFRAGLIDIVHSQPTPWMLSLYAHEIEAFTQTEQPPRPRHKG